MKKYILQKTLLALSLAGIVLSAGACSKKNDIQQIPPGTPPEKGDWLIIHQLSDPEGLNPFTVNDASSRDIFMYIYEPLLELDFNTAELTPLIAEARPTVSADNLTYSFTLRKDVTFSDGKPLTAKDVVFSLKAVKNPFVTNAAAARNYFADIADAVALDDYTVKFTMTQPYFLAEYFIGNEMRILPKHIFDPKNLTDRYTIPETNNVELAEENAAMKEFGAWFDDADRKRDKKYIVGSGPYLFDEWRTNEILKLVRNEQYWNKAKKAQYPDKIVFRTMPDRTVAVNALKNGDLDFISYIPPLMFGEIDTLSTPYLAAASYSNPVYMYLGWNARKPVFADKRTRQGLSHLVDRTMLIKNVMRGFADPCNSPIFLSRPEYDTTLKGYEYNPAKALALFKSAGWSDSDGDGILDKVHEGKKITFSFTILVNAGNETRENIALLLVDEMKKVGIEAKVQKLEWSVYLENVRTHAFEATIGAWVNDPIPSDPYQLWHSSQSVNKGSNYCGFVNKRADEIIEQNRLTFDEQKRHDLMIEFQRIVYEEQPYTFLWFLRYPTAYHKRIQNVSFFSVRPGYDVASWWVPRSMQTYL